MFLKVCERLKQAGKDLTALRDLHVIAHGSRKHDVVSQMVAMLDRLGWPPSAIERTYPPFVDSDHQSLDPAFLW